MVRALGAFSQSLLISHFGVEALQDTKDLVIALGISRTKAIGVSSKPFLFFFQKKNLSSRLFICFRSDVSSSLIGFLLDQRFSLAFMEPLVIPGLKQSECLMCSLCSAFSSL